MFNNGRVLGCLQKVFDYMESRYLKIIQTKIKEIGYWYRMDWQKDISIDGSLSCALL